MTKYFGTQIYQISYCLSHTSTIKFMKVGCNVLRDKLQMEIYQWSSKILPPKGAILENKHTNSFIDFEIHLLFFCVV